MQAKYTVAPLLADHPINVTVMRGQLTRNLATLIPGIVDEIQTTLQDLIRVEGDGEMQTLDFSLFGVLTIVFQSGFTSMHCKLW